MQQADYRAQARAVRAEAQRKLREFRLERRSAARRAPEAEPEAAAQMDETPSTASTPHPFDPGFGGASFEDMSVMTVSADAARLTADADSTPGDARATDLAPQPTAARPAQAAAPAADAAPAPPQRPALRARREWRVPAPGRARRAADDGPEALAALPGVGPGLVWLLGEAGVDSLSSLAAADPDALADRLGLVGRLVDVEALRALARARLG